MSRRTIAGGLAIAAAITVTTLPAASVAAEQVSVKFPSARFPLGARPVPTKTMTAVTQGIDLYDVKAGTSTDGYTLTVLMPNGRDSGTLPNAETKVAEVEAIGRPQPAGDRAARRGRLACQDRVHGPGRPLAAQGQEEGR